MADPCDMVPNVPVSVSCYFHLTMIACFRSLGTMVLAGLPMVIRAQPSFTDTHGMRMDQRALGIAASPSGFKTAVGAFRHPGAQTGEIWTFSTSGAPTGQVPLGIAGQCFVQGGAPNTNGQYFIAGSVIPPGSDQHEALLVKVSSTNAVLFTHVGSAPQDQQFFDVAPLPDGGAIACGLDDTSGEHNALVARIDASGALVWSVTLPGTLSTEANAVVVNGSNVMITGSQKNFGGTTDCFFARLDLNGNVSWTTSWGNAGNDAGEDLAATSSSTFVMAGHCDACGDLDQTEDRYMLHDYLIKIDLAGDTVWTAVLGDTLFDRQAFTLDVASNGDLLVGGERNERNLVDALVYRTDDAAHPIWEKTYDAGRWDRLLDLKALADGFVATGWSYGAASRQVLVVRKDQNGE